jgi:hypothetical protein
MEVRFHGSGELVDEVKQNMAVILLVMEVEHREEDDERRHARAKVEAGHGPTRLGEDGEGPDGLEVELGVQEEMASVGQRSGGGRGKREVRS